MKNLTATLCLTIALLFGCTGVCKSADFQTGLTAYKSGDYATALREWTPLAEQGDASAQTILGWMYQKGKGVPQDYKTAVKWYGLAAEQGYALPQYNLGNKYAYGQGVPQDYKTAVKWYRLAAEQGYADAQYNLGVMYDNGWGVPQDNVDSYMWYNLAASSGNKGAVTKGDIVAKRMTPADITSAQNLALLMQIDPNFQNGVTASQRGDFATNLREWTPLAEQGDAVAQFNLGVMYNQGQGVPQDNKTAVKWYKFAAEQGHASAQHYLGVMYHEGQGVPQDNKTAVKWYKLAAEQGDADAQLNLGVMYAAPKDYVYAHMWGEIAASNGNKLGAMLRDDFEKKMTPSQISEAQQLARECIRKKYKGC